MTARDSARPARDGDARMPTREGGDGDAWAPAREGGDAREGSGAGTVAGTLYVVATPIGNLEDITLRALRVLREVSLIAAEDTRHTRRLLARHGIVTPLLSYREQNRAGVTPRILGQLTRESVALVSDAGMPGIADPGAELIAAVIAAGGRVEALPGANAALTALVASGLPPAPFTFVGFLSRQRGARRRQLEELAGRRETLVLYEAPHRVVASLREMRAVFGERAAAACRELSKVHEEIRRGSIGALLEYYTESAPRGEFTLVIAGAPPATAPPAHNHLLSDDEVEERLRDAMASDAEIKEALRALSVQSGLSRRTLYARWQELRRAQGGA